ncbi:unnamed protein product [marine sediment metagenome]|uniref:Uncharacterized protein n=1 Tax=marine sediment metagenome TaxID=412755 RepID=X1KI54_9ZZZZ
MGNGKGLAGLIALVGLVLIMSRDEVANGIIPTYVTPTITIPAPIIEIKPIGWHRTVIHTKMQVVAEELEELGLDEELGNGNGVALPHKVFIQKKKLVDPTFEMPVFPIYPQVTPERPRIDPKIAHYEEALAEKYPEELEATQEAYKATRKILGLKEQVIPPMPKVTAPTRRVRR